MNSHFMAFWTKGKWTVHPKFPILSVTNNSKTAELGSLYVAIKGSRLDGHDFVQQAFDSGATAAIVSRDWEIPEALANLPLLCVDETKQALLDLAAGWRNTLDCFLVGITGSAGKTTVKELTAAFFSGAGKTGCTKGNLNNEIGLPMSLLSLTREMKYAVIEAGISHPFEMFPLASTMRPQAAIITSIGPAHIEFFGTEEAIAAEKGQLLQCLPSNGFAVMSKETSCFGILKELCPARIVTTSITDNTADYFGEPLAKGVLRVYHADEPAILLESGLCGSHNASNVLLAYAATREAGLSQDEALNGLATFKPPAMRWQVYDAGEIHFINDAYNSNPLSLSSALETFAGTDVCGEKIACVGDMLELGDKTEELHRQVGIQSGNGPWKLLIGIGANSKFFLDGAVEAGYPRNQTCWFPTTDAAVEEINLLLNSSDTVLIKGSRSMTLEKLIIPFEPTL